MMQRAVSNGSWNNSCESPCLILQAARVLTFSCSALGNEEPQTVEEEYHYDAPVPVPRAPVDRMPIVDKRRPKVPPPFPRRAEL
jgi:hypothetical protein